MKNPHLSQETNQKRAPELVEQSSLQLLQLYLASLLSCFQLLLDLLQGHILLLGGGQRELCHGLFGAGAEDQLKGLPRGSLLQLLHLDVWERRGKAEQRVLSAGTGSGDIKSSLPKLSTAKSPEEGQLGQEFSFQHSNTVQNVEISFATLP